MIQRSTFNSDLGTIFFYSVFFLILSVYVVYEQATDCLSIEMAEQVKRHTNMLLGKSEFFNPWQYRIFSTYILQGFIIVFNKVSPIENPYVPFFLLRFFQNLAIFFVAFKFYKTLKLESNLLIVMGILLLGYNMSNSVFKSDLSFNTYFDVLFYLLAGYLILKNKFIWILPLMVIASLNRETSGLIPILVMLFSIDFKNKEVKHVKAFKIGLYALLIYVTIFFALRLYYGMPLAHGINGMTSPLEFLKFNITFFRMYPELFGTLGIIPLIIIMKYNDLNSTIRLFLITVVPIWFLIHFLKSQAMETRLFLVPHALVFIPAFLFLVEKELRKKLGFKGF